MKYQDQLTPWVVYQISSTQERQAVTRFRRRNDADCYLKVLKQTRPNAEFLVIFESKPVAPAAPEKELVEA